MGKNSKLMEVLIGKVKSELDESNKDELMSIMSVFNMNELQDDPVFYMMIKQLSLDTKLTSMLKQTHSLSNGLKDVEEAVLVLAKKMNINLDSDELTKSVVDSVEKAIIDAIPGSLEVSVSSSDSFIRKEIKSQLMPLIHTVTELTKTIEIENIKRENRIDGQVLIDHKRDDADNSDKKKKGSLTEMVSGFMK